jgi:hypothetical protein
MKQLTILRVISTAVLYFLCGVLNTALTAYTNVALTQSAVGQFQDSNQAYVEWTLANRLLHGSVIPLALLLLGSLWVWWRPLREKSEGLARGLAVLSVVIVCLFAATPAHAYYDTTDRAEWVNIEANQSAFLIPAIGANKTNQAQFGSVQYLAENKVASKRVQIPHIVAANTALIKDYYVPGATLYLIDRTLYTREWAEDAT